MVSNWAKRPRAHGFQRRADDEGVSVDRMCASDMSGFVNQHQDANMTFKPRLPRQCRQPGTGTPDYAGHQRVSAQDIRPIIWRVKHVVCRWTHLLGAGPIGRGRLVSAQKRVRHEWQNRDHSLSDTSRTASVPTAERGVYVFSAMPTCRELRQLRTTRPLRSSAVLLFGRHPLKRVDSICHSDRHRTVGISDLEFPCDLERVPVAPQLPGLRYFEISATHGRHHLHDFD